MRHNEIFQALGNDNVHWNASQLGWGGKVGGCGVWELFFVSLDSLWQCGKKEEGMKRAMKHWWWQLGRELDPDKCHWTCWLCTMNVLWQFSVCFRQGARLLLFYAFQSWTICHIKFTMPSQLLFDNATWVCVNSAGYEGWATRCKRLKSVWHVGKKTSSQQASCLSEVTTQQIQSDFPREELLHAQGFLSKRIQFRPGGVILINKRNTCLCHIKLGNILIVQWVLTILTSNNPVLYIAYIFSH